MRIDPQSDYDGDPLEFCPFPKHKGVDWYYVLELDRPYIEWLVGGDCNLNLSKTHADLEDFLMDLLERPED